MIELYQPDSPLPPDTVYSVLAHSDAAGSHLDAAHPAWAGAHPVTWGPETARTTFAALWDARGLAVRFDVHDTAPWHTMKDRDAPIWNEEVVEIFLDPTATGRDYFEVEFNPVNVVTDLHIRAASPALDGNLAWNWAGLESRVVPAGGRGGGPDSWVVLGWFPWAGLRGVSVGVDGCLPPAVGSRWAFNVFRIKRPGGPTAPERGAIYAAWSAPDGRTFHAPAFFRPLVFGGPVEATD